MPLEETSVASTATDAPAITDSASSTEPEYRTMTDDQILDSSEDSIADRPAASDETDSKPVSEAKSVEQSRKEEKPVKGEKTEDELEEDYEPESIKKLYSQPELKAKMDALFEAHPKVRSAWFRAAQVAELFPTFAEARELRTLFPTVDGAKMASNAVAVLTNLDQAYVDDPKTFVSNLSRGNPGAFSKMLESAREVLYQQSPNEYARVIGNPAALDLMHNAQEMANETGDEALQAALEIVADRFKFPGTGPAKPTVPEDPRIRQYETLKREATDARAQAFDAFSGRTDQAYWDGLNKFVSDAIGKPEAMTQKAIERVASEVIRDITNEIARRSDLKPQYEHFKRAGDLTDGHRERVANFLLNYAKSYVGKAVRTRMGEWTNEILRANKDELKRVDAKPKHKDVGSGSGQADSPKHGAGKIDYRKTTDDQLLDGAF